MNLETILDAMIEAYDPDSFPGRERQYHAFRNRIIRMDAEKGEEIAERRKAMANLGIQIHEWADKHYEAKQRIAELEAESNRRLELLEKALSYLVDYQHIFDGDTIEDLNMLSYFIEDVAKELSDDL